MDTAELKNCPFCGFKAELVNNPHTGTKTIAQCVSCGASVFWKKWQNRAYDDLLECLRELYAIVRGECPRLFNEDSGGNAELEMAIIDAIAKAEGK